ncbi:Rha family transcriptional regulator [Acinetobacter beijerinckii]|uniref:phage regulatory CII family protein n=1 Tax=Acinetobacter beijerinckii TaxID=262668 RepID=UPI0023DD67B7|nr:phage regulatory CII family protein [Acinetobacter beijerinckii]MDF2418048.1 Rha family transcriptional regulator [Acinetobacter beijerinckii]
MLLTINERKKFAVLSLELAIKAAVSNSDKDDCLLAIIAQKNGFNINTFRSSVNPTTATHKANIHHLEAILSETQDPRIMDSLCAIHGNAGWFELPNTKGLTDADFITKIGHLAREQGDLSQSIATAIADKVITKDEADVIHKDVLNLVRASMNLWAMVEAYREVQNA